MFLAPWSWSRLKKITGVGAALENNQKPVAQKISGSNFKCLGLWLIRFKLCQFDQAFKSRKGIVS